VAVVKAGLKRIALTLCLIVVAGAAYYFGGRWYERSLRIQRTDDAYVGGEITAISSRVSGYAVEVPIDENYQVRAAQVLVRIDPREYRMNVEKAQAALDQDKADLNQIVAQRELQQSKIAVAQAALQSAQAQVKNADITLQRSTTLLARNDAPQSTVDANTAAAAQAHAAADQASANLTYEHGQMIVLDAREAVAKAQIASAEAALLSAKFDLDDTETWAPIDGIVANLKTRVGMYVAAGTQMMSIVPIHDLWIDANYRETQITYMKPGDPARISLDTYPQTPLCGYVESVAPASGTEFALIPPDNATGNFTKIVRRFTVRLRFNARESKASLARPGMSVETAVAVSSPGGAAAAERASTIGCSFDPTKDIVQRTPTRLPEHPGLGRARPQGATGIVVPQEPAPPQ
jgi:membrane fusion protein, multidrug efflux system